MPESIAQNGMERRTIPLPSAGNMEIRQQGDVQLIQGHGAIFNQETVIANTFRERIRPGAFLESIQGDGDVTSFFNHNPNYILGRRSAGTLTELREDEIGLWYQVKVPDTSWAADLVESIRRRDIFGNSFSFTVPRDGEIWTDEVPGKLPLRTLMKINLNEVGPVTQPAYDGTDVDARHVFQRALQHLGSSSQKRVQQMRQRLANWELERNAAIFHEPLPEWLTAFEVCSLTGWRPSGFWETVRAFGIQSKRGEDGQPLYRAAVINALLQEWNLSTLETVLARAKRAKAPWLRYNKP